MGVNRSEPLGRQDWIAAGLAAMAEGGVDAVRVDPLAKSLGITRGSFYWHFSDRRALLDAVLEAWAAQQTDAVIARAEALGRPPAETLRELLRLCFEDDGRMEKALRSWATQDADVARTIGAVDGRRIAHLANLIKQSGVPAAPAESRARLAYRTWLGDYALVDRPDRRARDEDVDALHAFLVG